MTSPVKALLKAVGPSLLACGTLLVTTGITPAAAAPGGPTAPFRQAGPTRLVQPPTATQANPQVTTPASSASSPLTTTVGNANSSVTTTVGDANPQLSPPTGNPPLSSTSGDADANVTLPYGNRVVSTPAGTDHKVRIPTSPRVAAVTDDSRDEVVVVAIDSAGVMKTVIKKPDSTLDPSSGEPDGFWGEAFNLSPALFPANAPLTVVYQPTSKQIEAFAIDDNGALQNVRRVHFGSAAPLWEQPVALTGPGFAPPGAPVTAIFQPLNEQLEVYVVGNDGAVMGVWNEHNGPWQPAFNLTAAGFAPRYSELAPVWADSIELTAVFVVDNSGTLQMIWKLHDRAWQTPKTASDPGFSSPGSSVAAVWEPKLKNLDVFTLDQTGTAKVVTKKVVEPAMFLTSFWPSATPLFSNTMSPGGGIAAAWNDDLGSPTVAVVDAAGAVHETSRVRGEWLSGRDAITNQGFAPTGALLAVAPVPFSKPIVTATEQHVKKVHTVGVFGVDPSRGIRLVSNDRTGTPLTKPNYAPIYGTHTAYCMGKMRPLTMSESAKKDCADFLGLTAYCESLGAHVVFGYKPNSEQQFLTCGQNSRPETFIEQFADLSQRLEKIVTDAFVAVYPILGPIVEGYACLDGALFACATLAVDVVHQVPELKDVSPEALDLGGAAADCVDGDILACARLGSKGAQKAGVNIPGESLVQAAQDSQACASDDFQACMRLGEQAADAAGVPVDSLKQAAQEAQACYNGDFDACTSLGKHAARLGVPVGGVANGADNLNACTGGDIVACTQLGQSLAAVPR